MLSTSRDRGYVVFGGAVIWIALSFYFSWLFFVWLAALGALGAVFLGLAIYDWIISGDEVLSEEAAQQRRERGLE